MRKNFGMTCHNQKAKCEPGTSGSANHNDRSLYMDGVNKYDIYPEKIVNNFYEYNEDYLEKIKSDFEKNTDEEIKNIIKKDIQFIKKMDNGKYSFKDYELLVYAYTFGEKLQKQNIKYYEGRHYNRMQTIEEKYKKNQPFEMIIQVGNKENRLDDEKIPGFQEAVKKFKEKMEEEGITILNTAYHESETSPHFHIRYYTLDSEKNFNLNSMLKEKGIEKPFDMLYKKYQEQFDAATLKKSDLREKDKKYYNGRNFFDKDNEFIKELIKNDTETAKLFLPVYKEDEENKNKKELLYYGVNKRYDTRQKIFTEYMREELISLIEEYCDVNIISISGTKKELENAKTQKSTSLQEYRKKQENLEKVKKINEEKEEVIKEKEKIIKETEEINSQIDIITKELEKAEEKESELNLEIDFLNIDKKTSYNKLKEAIEKVKTALNMEREEKKININNLESVKEQITNFKNDLYNILEKVSFKESKKEKLKETFEKEVMNVFEMINKNLQLEKTKEDLINIEKEKIKATNELNDINKKNKELNEENDKIKEKIEEQKNTIEYNKKEINKQNTQIEEQNKYIEKILKDGESYNNVLKEIQEEDKKIKDINTNLKNITEIPSETAYDIKETIKYKKVKMEGTVIIDKENLKVLQQAKEIINKKEIEKLEKDKSKSINNIKIKKSKKEKFEDQLYGILNGDISYSIEQEKRKQSQVHSNRNKNKETEKEL